MKKASLKTMPTKWQLKRSFFLEWEEVSASASDLDAPKESPLFFSFSTEVCAGRRASLRLSLSELPLFRDSKAARLRKGVPNIFPEVHRPSSGRHLKDSSYLHVSQIATWTAD